MARGLTGDGWYGPAAPAVVSVGGNTVSNSARVIMMGLADLGSDIAFNMRGVVQARLTDDFAEQSGVKAGGQITWLLPMQYHSSGGTKLNADDKTPLYRPRRHLRLLYHRKTAHDMNAMARAIYHSDEEIRQDIRSALLPLATFCVRKTTEVCTGNYTYSAVNSARTTLANPGELPEASLSDVRDGAKLFSNLATSMEERGVIGNMQRLHGFLNLRHAESMALETLSPFNPRDVVNRMFRDPRAKGLWYGSNIQGMRLVAKQNIGSLNGTGAIQLASSVSDGSKTWTLKGFGASQTGVIAAGCTIGAKSVKAVDPVDKEVLEEEYQVVIAPQDGTGTYDGGSFMSEDRLYDSNASGQCAVTVATETYFGTTGANRGRQNVSRQPATNFNVLINGIEISGTAQRQLLAGKKQSMSHFYRDGAILQVTKTFKRVGAGVNTVSMTSQARKISVAYSTAGDIDELDETSRFDVGTFGLAMKWEEYGARLGGKAA